MIRGPAEYVKRQLMSRSGKRCARCAYGLNVQQAFVSLPYANLARLKRTRSVCPQPLRMLWDSVSMWVEERPCWSHKWLAAMWQRAPQLHARALEINAQDSWGRVESVTIENLNHAGTGSRAPSKFIALRTSSKAEWQHH
eukprot:1554192-Amphidinium_carterae.1